MSVEQIADEELKIEVGSKHVIRHLRLSYLGFTYVATENGNLIFASHSDKNGQQKMKAVYVSTGSVTDISRNMIWVAGHSYKEFNKQRHRREYEHLKKLLEDSRR